MIERVKVAPFCAVAYERIMLGFILRGIWMFWLIRQAKEGIRLGGRSVV